MKILECPPSMLEMSKEGPWEAMTEIWEHQPLTQETLIAGPLGGAEARDPGAPTINAKKHRWRGPWEAVPEIWERPPSMLKNVDSGPPGPRGGGGGLVRLLSGIRKVCCDMHRHDRQKVIILMGSILPALSSVMADDP
jgi:hypothetical protein